MKPKQNTENQTTISTLRIYYYTLCAFLSFIHNRSQTLVTSYLFRKNKAICESLFLTQCCSDVNSRSDFCWSDSSVVFLAWRLCQGLRIAWGRSLKVHPHILKLYLRCSCPACFVLLTAENKQQSNSKHLLKMQYRGKCWEHSWAPSAHKVNIRACMGLEKKPKKDKINGALL